MLLCECHFSHQVQILFAKPKEKKNELHTTH